MNTNDFILKNIHVHMRAQVSIFLLQIKTLNLADFRSVCCEFLREGVRCCVARDWAVSPGCRPGGEWRRVGSRLHPRGSHHYPPAKASHSRPPLPPPAPGDVPVSAALARARTYHTAPCNITQLPSINLLHWCLNS